MKRYDIINRIIDKKGYKTYLEIGVRDGECFRQINCNNKFGVDPSPITGDTTHIMTSDEFFDGLDQDIKFDIVFIDGLHLDFQVDRDIENSLKHLSEGGTIVLHDCNPPTKYHAGEYPVFSEPANGEWNGTVYLSLLKIRLYREDLRLFTVDTDWGVGILTKKSSNTLEVFPNEAMSWEYFSNNRKEILDLISEAEFEEMYSNYILD